MKYFSLLFLGLIVLFSCAEQSVKKTLPILGEKDVVNGDTLYHTAPNFTFINQDSLVITPKTFENKAYVVDYFFTSCPTICPTVKQEGLRVAERFKDEEKLKLLSVSIDTGYDTIPRLKWYADKLEIDSKQWHLVTGNKKEIYGIAKDFFHVAIEDKNEPGGFNHDGRLILVDKNKHIRAFCDALKPEEVDRFMDDIEFLLAEQ